MHQTVAPLLLALLALPLTAAAFNPQLSEDRIPLNATIEATFATSMPDKEHVDIVAAVEQACALPTVRDRWQLVRPPTVVQHPKAKDIQVQLLLAPRSTGTLQPPAIPVKWLDGDREARFPPVLVEEHLRLGGDQIPLPKELQSVGGYRWGISLAEYAAAQGEEVPTTTSHIARPKAGLELRFEHSQLTTAVLRIANLTLDDARPLLLERWGDIATTADGSMGWRIGWLAITATETAEGIDVLLEHEGLRRRQARAQVKTALFDVLEGDAPEAPAPPPTDNRKPASLPDGPAGDNEVTVEEIEEQFKRAVDANNPDRP